MKKIALITLILISTLGIAQKNKSDNKIPDLDKIVYKNALKYNDPITAINTLHRIIATEGDNSVYKDSLAVVYFNTNNFVSSYLVSEELLKNKPNNIALLEINAISLQNIGDAKKAVTAFETLFKLSKNQYHGYQLAVLQNSIKRLGEAQITIDQTLKCEELKDLVLQFTIDKEKNQNVPLKAAIFNLKGLVAYELKDFVTAKSAFQDALVVFPEFELAKQNAAAITIETEK